MKTHTQFVRWSATVAALGLAASLVACGGSGGYGGSAIAVMPPPPSTSTFAAKSLVVDVAATPPYGSDTTRQIDANLINPWGLAFNPQGFVWVANNGTSSSALYDGNGVAQTLVVTLPAGASAGIRPTGIVFNGSTDFKLSQGGLSGAGAFLFAGESGVIAGWAPSVDRTHSVIAVDNGAQGSIYKGLAIASYAGQNYLYAADFHNNRVDVFDASFTRTTLPGSFVDPTLPAGYAPFGIQAIKDRIYVSYARQDANAEDEIAGPGLGYVVVYDTAGNMVKELIAGGMLNAPWGIAMAPNNFGTFSGALLVANFGDGRINAYDSASGALLGALTGANGLPLVFDGLWGIAFGNGLNNQPTNTLFFTAGPGQEAHGVYGRIDLN